jgi:PAS domain-containing protein
MHRFLLKQNIQRYQRLLEGETEMRPRAMLQSTLAVWQRQLAVLDAETRGAAVSARASRNSAQAKRFRRELEALEDAAILLNPGPGLQIIHTNDALRRVVPVEASRIWGERLFTAFPDNPRQEADGVSRLYASLRIAASTGRAHAMPLQRYDVQDEDGRFVERWWRLTDTPIFDEDDRLLYLLHQAEDVTAQVLRSRAATPPEAS